MRICVLFVILAITFIINIIRQSTEIDSMGAKWYDENEIPTYFNIIHFEDEVYELCATAQHSQLVVKNDVYAHTANWHLFFIAYYTRIYWISFPSIPFHWMHVPLI